MPYRTGNFYIYIWLYSKGDRFRNPSNRRIHRGKEGAFRVRNPCHDPTRAILGGALIAIT